MGDQTEPLLDSVPDTFGNESSSSSFPRDDQEAAVVADDGTNAIDPAIRCTLDEGESQHSGARKATVRFNFATCSTKGKGDSLIPFLMYHVDSKIVSLLTSSSSIHVC
jgi:hypothetical protein